MTSPAQPDRYQFEYPDEAGYPDGIGTLTEDQVTLIDQVLDSEEKPDFDFTLINDEENSIYEALVGDTEIGGITYSLAGDRIVLLAAAVHPEFRHQGIATEMIRRVLDDVRAQGKTTTILCPIVRTYIDNHPYYEPLVDPKHPGVKSAGHR
jgi:predicted GNAT family acetyltransferase